MSFFGTDIGGAWGGPEIFGNTRDHTLESRVGFQQIRGGFLVPFFGFWEAWRNWWKCSSHLFIAGGPHSFYSGRLYQERLSQVEASNRVSAN